MKFVAATLFALLSTGLAFAHENAPPSPAGSAPKDVAEIANTFHEALAKGDGAAAQALLDDNVQIYEQGWVERSKAEYAAHHLESDLAFSAATTSEQTARTGTMLGELAYVTTEGRISGSSKGKPVDSVTLETMVLRQTPGGWRIVHIHWSSRAAKK